MIIDIASTLQNTARGKPIDSCRFHGCLLDRRPRILHIRGRIRYQRRLHDVARDIADVWVRHRVVPMLTGHQARNTAPRTTRPPPSCRELVGIWVVTVWQQMGCPPRLRVVELGPGRGTLMADLLRGTAAFAPFSRALSVDLVEVSPALRDVQWSTLRCRPSQPSSDRGKDTAPASETSGPSMARRGEGVSGVSLESASETDMPRVRGERAGSGGMGRASEGSHATGVGDAPLMEGVSGISGARVRWWRSMDDVSEGQPTVYVLHELLDALPVHQVQC